MSNLPFLIVKTGEAEPEARALGGDFEDWFVAGLGRDRFDYRVARVDRGDSLPAPETLAGVLVTGSPAMVSHRADWSEATAEWLKEAFATGVPMLGVCYGHQLLAHALGGRVEPNPAGRRMGRVAVDVLDPEDPLLGRFAPAEGFHVSHVEVVLEPPEGARIIGTTPHDPHHALHFGGQAWGVQFHPEFGRAVMRAYIQARVEALRADGQDPALCLSSVVDDTAGPMLLARFGALAAGIDRPQVA